MFSQKSTIFFALALFGLIILILALGMSKERSVSKNGLEVTAVTDKQEYIKGEEVLKVKIENTSEKKICFSSCSPFYLQKKGDGYDGFNYKECLDDLAETCVDPSGVKAFAINLPSKVEGEYLLAIPACVGCSAQQKFREDQKIYSNEFVIK